MVVVSGSPRPPDCKRRRLPPEVTGHIGMDAGRYQAIERSRHKAERRRDAITVADVLGRAAAAVWRCRRTSFGPAQERRHARLALRMTVQASRYYLDAGLGRQAALCGRAVSMFGRSYHSRY
jgi:hypothetical protein